MAVSGLPSVKPQAVQPPVENRDVRAAQRAFFQAALARTGAVAPAPGQPASAPIQAPAPIRAAATPEPAAEPARHYRPGSLLDIKI